MPEVTMSASDESVKICQPLWTAATPRDPLDAHRMRDSSAACRSGRRTDLRQLLALGTG